MRPGSCVLGAYKADAGVDASLLGWLSMLTGQSCCVKCLWLLWTIDWCGQRGVMGMNRARWAVVRREQPGLQGGRLVQRKGLGCIIIHCLGRERHRNKRGHHFALCCHKVKVKWQLRALPCYFLCSQIPIECFSSRGLRARASSYTIGKRPLLELRATCRQLRTNWAIGFAELCNVIPDLQRHGAATTAY